MTFCWWPPIARPKLALTQAFSSVSSWNGIQNFLIVYAVVVEGSEMYWALLIERAQRERTKYHGGASHVLLESCADHVYFQPKPNIRLCQKTVNSFPLPNLFHSYYVFATSKCISIYSKSTSTPYGIRREKNNASRVIFPRLTTLLLIDNQWQIGRARVLHTWSDPESLLTPNSTRGLPKV